MIHIVAFSPQNEPADRPRLPFYLAMEEWVARHLPPAEYFFTWRVAPTVIFGRNQEVAREVDLDYCRDKGIEVFRRRSGGGCVYADFDNIMISYITPSTDVATTFADYTQRIAAMLKSLGIDAKASGRNDVMIGDRKVSGNAFYHLCDRSIVHGTMLYSTNMENMLNAITPSRSKLESRRVKSVESHITTVSEYLPNWDIEKFNNYIIQYLSDGELCLTDADIAEIREIERRYYDLHWIFGRRGVLSVPKQQVRRFKRIEGVGEINIVMEIQDSKITDIEMTGDFFLLTDLDEAIFSKIKNLPLTEDALKDALKDVDVTKVISNLTTEDFISILIGS